MVYTATFIAISVSFVVTDGNIMDGNNIITNKTDIANKFNSFFTNVGTNLSNKITIPNKIVNFKFNFYNIGEANIRHLIDKLAPKTSLGFDGLSSKLLKSIEDAVIKPIAIIINQMINTVIFPNQLKMAKIVPVYKKR